MSRTRLRAVPDEAVPDDAKVIGGGTTRPLRCAPLGDTGWTAADRGTAPGVDSQALDLWLPGGTVVRLRTTPLPGGRPGAVHLVLDAIGDRDDLIELIVSPMVSRTPRRRV